MMSLKREAPNILTVSILCETIFSSLMFAKLLCIRVIGKSFGFVLELGRWYDLN